MLSFLKCLILTKNCIINNIIILLFIFGVSIGANHDLISNIGYFGWQAFVIAVLGMIGSFGTAYMFNRFINNKEQNNNER